MDFSDDYAKPAAMEVRMEKEIFNPMEMTPGLEQPLSDTLVLYYRPNCPYCVKVLNFLKEIDVDVAMKDLSNSEYREELLEIGGKTQVPCLMIDDKPLYESDDIIAWFDQNRKGI